MMCLCCSIMQRGSLEQSPKAGIAHGYVICQEGSQGSVGVEKDVLESRAPLPHHQRHRACRLPSPRDGCRAVKVGVRAGVLRAVLQSRVPVSQGTVCWARDSAACQGQLSACPGSSPWRCGEKLWVEGVTPVVSRQGPSAVVRVLHGSCFLPAPDHPQDICRGSFWRRTSRQHLPERNGAHVLNFPPLVGWMGSGRKEFPFPFRMAPPHHPCSADTFPGDTPWSPLPHPRGEMFKCLPVLTLFEEEFSPVPLSPLLSLFLPFFHCGGG